MVNTLLVLMSFHLTTEAFHAMLIDGHLKLIWEIFHEVYYRFIQYCRWKYAN